MQNKKGLVIVAVIMAAIFTYFLVGLITSSPMGGHFPQKRFRPDGYIDIGPHMGYLVLENGCLRLQDVQDTYKDDYLLIWDPRFTTQMEQGVIQIVDTYIGEVVAGEGDYVMTTGGGLFTQPTWMTWFTLRLPIPSECSGPYLEVGDSMKRVERIIEPSLGNHFPQLALSIGNTDNILQGELVLENGCLRVNRVDKAESYLLIWESGFSSTTDQDVVHVINGITGEILASTGDFVVVGGGVAPPDIHSYLREPTPAECPGPYWLVGQTVRKIGEP